MTFMLHGFLLWPLAGATIVQATAHPAQPLKPSGGWTVDYGETQCMALRKFRSADEERTFGIRPAFNKESFELMLSREGSGPTSIEQEPGTVDFGAGPIKTRVLRYKTPGSKLSVQRYRLAAEEVRRASNARQLTLKIGNKTVSLAVSGLGPLINALDTCLADLRQYWNSDTTPATVAVSARGDLRRIFTGNEYPSLALIESLEGEATFTLLVDERGRVAGCDLAKPSGVPVLDVMGCEVFRKRARFKPARNAAGDPVRDTVTSPPVRWILQ